LNHSRTSTRARRIAALAAGVMLATCLADQVAADQVYRSVDAEGHVVYSDHAESPSAQKTDIHVIRPDPEQVAQYVREQQILKAEDKERKKQQAAAAAAESKKSQAEQARATECENARRQYDSIKDRRRLYSQDADGNRVYLSDSDADAKREEARQAVTAACGS